MVRLTDLLNFVYILDFKRVRYLKKEIATCLFPFLITHTQKFFRCKQNLKMKQNKAGQKMSRYKVKQDPGPSSQLAARGLEGTRWL